MEQDQDCFTVGVFKDSNWAERGLEALGRDHFPKESLSMVAQYSPETEALLKKIFGIQVDPVSISGVGEVVSHGLLVKTLQGSDNALTLTGIAATISRAGFQVHDGFIFETLTSQGGVLVAIQSEPRAADALALLHSYGGGNAAIGAWLGRV